jgi:hypothetical protein
MRKCIHLRVGKSINAWIMIIHVIDSKSRKLKGHKRHHVIHETDLEEKVTSRSGAHTKLIL